MLETIQRWVCSYSWLDDRRLRRVLEPVQGKVLDVGCGNRRLRPYLNRKCDYTGIDFNPKADVQINIAKERYPFKDNSFDFVVCNAVLEHVEDEQFVLKEIHRVLKPGGQLYVSIPFIQPYHADPEDYRRFTLFGLGHLLKKNGFTLIESPGSLYGTMLTIEYLVFTEAVETIKRKRFMNPLRWFYLGWLFLVYIVCKIGNIVFRPLQSNDHYVSPESSYLCKK